MRTTTVMRTRKRLCPVCTLPVEDGHDDRRICQECVKLADALRLETADAATSVRPGGPLPPGDLAPGDEEG